MKKPSKKVFRPGHTKPHIFWWSPARKCWLAQRRYPGGCWVFAVSYVSMAGSEALKKVIRRATKFEPIWTDSTGTEPRITYGFKP